ncbi:MAG: hypothetical protein ACE5FY_00400 [Nitrospiria bacterium]
MIIAIARFGSKIRPAKERLDMLDPAPSEIELQKVIQNKYIFDKAKNKPFLVEALISTLIEKKIVTAEELTLAIEKLKADLK